MPGAAMSNKDWIKLIGLSLLWGGSFFFVELALRGLPPLSVVWGRVALAAVFLAATLLLTGGAFPKGRMVWLALIGMGFLNNAVPFILFALAQGQISGAMAAILNATTPLFSLALAHLVTVDEKITWPKAVGLALGFTGVVVMMGGMAIVDVWASIACLAAAFSYATAAIFSRRFRALGVAPLTIACGQVTCSTLMLLPVWLWVDRPWAMDMPAAGSVLAVIGLAALSTALAYLIYFRLLASAGAINLSLVTFLIPVSAALLGAVFLGTRLHLQHLAGFALIAAGLAAIDGRLMRLIRRKAR